MKEKQNLRTQIMHGIAAAAVLSMLVSPAFGAQVPATAPGAHATLPAGVVARVNGVAIAQSEVDAAVRQSGQADTPALRTSLKNQLIARELFRQVAQKQHYDTHADVKAGIEQAKAMLMMQAYLRDAIKPTPVTDADVKAKYDAIVASLGQNEYKPSGIMVKDAATAKTVLDQLKKGGDFAQLAKQYSQGPSAAQGGTLNWVSFKTPIVEGQTQGWPKPVAEALVKLPQGAVSSEPIQVGDAFWILRVDQMRPTQIPTFDQSRAQLRKELEQVAAAKATAQVVTDLVKSAHIEK
ncbi:MAG TPA: peptidyl-prolyl cis-trans isomerase [Trinickia sp.]|uniref:peptidylprolyl isomerase n=1 Tax=Trinickia sp. TaxID=2571163 RepID=UPI002C18520E|nr:peptidyl-prolyl cis-trans isomerase [Trinickia sp.]HVW53837.1 peptidyl-prolyl cis-trans isomerase [Trinickia sp.]